MTYIYATEHKIFKSDNISIDLNDYIKSTDIKQICYNCTHFAILTHDNKIYTCAYNNDSLKIIDKLSSIKQISLSSDELLILYETGELILKLMYLIDDYFNIISDKSIISINSTRYYHLIHKKDSLWILEKDYYSPSGIILNSIPIRNIIQNKIEFYYTKYHFVKLIEHNNSLSKIHCGSNNCIIQYNDDTLYLFDNMASLSEFNYKQILIFHNKNDKIKKISSLDYGTVILFNSGLMGIYDHIWKTFAINNEDIWDYWYIKDYPSQHIINLYFSNNNNLYTINYKSNIDINECTRKLLISNQKLIYVYDACIEWHWYPYNHLHFSKDIQNNILLLLMILKKKLKCYSLKIPKYLIYIMNNFLIL